MASGNVPDFDGAVVAAASDKFAVRRKSNGIDPVNETNQHQRRVAMAGGNVTDFDGRVVAAAQRRLTISRLRVPNLDGSVPTAAGNLLSIGAPHHRVDPEIVRNQDTNKQKQRGKNREKLTRPSARSPSTRTYKKELIKIKRKLTRPCGPSASSRNGQRKCPRF